MFSKEGAAEGSSAHVEPFDPLDVRGPGDLKGPGNLTRHRFMWPDGDARTARGWPAGGACMQATRGCSVEPFNTFLRNQPSGASRACI